VCVIAPRIVQEAVSPDVSVSDLATLATSDPGFAARVVSLVNSASFGLGNRVSDIRQACMLLGVRGLRNVALSLIVGDMVPLGADGNALLTISLRRAAAARLIGEALGERALDDAFTAGLFLEIALLARARDDLAGAAQVARMPAAHRPIIERSFGFADHAKAGAKLAGDMQLPQSIVEAVARHHDPVAPAAQFAKIMWAAERVAAAWEGGDVERIRDDARRALTSVGVPGAKIEGIFQRVPEILTNAAVTFDRPVDAQSDLDQLAVDAHAQLVELNDGYEELVRRLEALLVEKETLAEDLRRANAELANLATTDALTGLPNRRAFTEALARDLARAARAGTPLSLIMVDVDHFKSVNDTYGHQSGDLVLAKVAQVMRSCMRTGDVPARFGGEEFIAVLPGAVKEGAKVVADRIRIALESTDIACAGTTIRVTASFGVAMVRGPGCRDGADRLVAGADAALYEAKRSGRNRVVMAP
jgi:diguanylate cyclase (GGDEF)-like protein